jgi:ADP-ribose pyrophosphatase YjhB (NUDIX family)
MSDPEKILLNATLSFLIREVKGQPEILLARKMKKITAGFLNGYGGGIEEVDMNTTQGARRELLEEAIIMVPVTGLKKMAIVDFHNTTEQGEQFTCRVHIFLCTKWLREPKSTSEMQDPTWYPYDKIPYDEMAPADRYWLPKILAGEMFIAEAWLGSRQRELLRPVTFREILPEEMCIFEK